MLESIVLPPDHFNKRVKNQYNNVPLAIVREIVQNSQDAGAKRLEFAFSDNGYTAVDNGCGMDLEKARRVFLTLGGTQKANYCAKCETFTDSDSCCGQPTHKPTGGFGAAKEVLLFAWDSWEFSGQGFRMFGSGASNPESESGGVKRGFQIGAQGDGLSGDELCVNLYRLCGLSNLRIAVYDKSSKVPTGRTLRKNQIVKEFEFGTLYVHKSGNQQCRREVTGYLYTRTDGLYTGCDYVGGPFVYYLNITGDSTKVLTENRDSLRWDKVGEIRQVLEVELLRFLSGESDHDASPELTLYGMVKKQAQDTSNTSSDYVPAGAACSVTYAPTASAGIVQNAGNPTGANLDASIDFDGTPLPISTHTQPVPLTWRAPFAVYAENTTPKVESKEQGTLKAKFNKALEVWGATLNMVADCAELARPIPGLCYSNIAEGVHIESDNNHVVCGRPDVILKDNPFAIMELAIHEIAHYNENNHSAPYEIERFRIARLVGAAAPAILATIATLQAKSAKRGRYWEN